MAQIGTLADSFLADLDELSDDEPVQQESEQEQQQGEGDEVGACSYGHACCLGPSWAACGRQRGARMTRVCVRAHAAAPPQLDDIEALNYDDLAAVAKLSNSGVYKDTMQARAAWTQPQPRSHASCMMRTAWA